MRSRAGLVLGIVTLLLGVLAAGLLGWALPPAGRTFAAISDPVQTLLSVTVAFSGVLGTRQLPRPARPAMIVSTIGVGLAGAALVALFGVGVTAAVIGVSGSSPNRWDHLIAVALGSVLVQALALLVGTGLGLLLRSRIVACLLTIVLPLGAYAVLGVVDTLRPAQPWLAPYVSARRLLAGQMTPAYWVQWLGVFALWGVGLNLLGAWRASRPRER